MSQIPSPSLTASKSPLARKNGQVQRVSYLANHEVQAPTDKNIVPHLNLSFQRSKTIQSIPSSPRSEQESKASSPSSSPRRSRVLSHRKHTKDSVSKKASTPSTPPSQVSTSHLDLLSSPPSMLKLPRSDRRQHIGDHKKTENVFQRNLKNTEDEHNQKFADIQNLIKSLEGSSSSSNASPCSPKDISTGKSAPPPTGEAVSRDLSGTLDPYCLVKNSGREILLQAPNLENIGRLSTEHTKAITQHLSSTPAWLKNKNRLLDPIAKDIRNKLSPQAVTTFFNDKRQEILKNDSFLKESLTAFLVDSCKTTQGGDNPTAYEAVTQLLMTALAPMEKHPMSGMTIWKSTGREHEKKTLSLKDVINGIGYDETSFKTCLMASIKAHLSSSQTLKDTLFLTQGTTPQREDEKTDWKGQLSPRLFRKTKDTSQTDLISHFLTGVFTHLETQADFKESLKTQLFNAYQFLLEGFLSVFLSDHNVKQCIYALLDGAREGLKIKKIAREDMDVWLRTLLSSAIGLQLICPLFTTLANEAGRETPQGQRWIALSASLQKVFSKYGKTPNSLPALQAFFIVYSSSRGIDRTDD